MHDHLTLLLFCLGQNFPAPITEALLTLADNDASVGETREVWDEHEYDDLPYIWNDRFADAVERVTGLRPICCDFCCDWVSADYYATVADGDDVCDPCIESNFSRCYECEGYHRDEMVNEVEDRTYCGRCMERHCNYCDYCEEWYRNWDHAHDDDECDNCGCEAPNQRFRFPANGEGTVGNDERLSIPLPAGTIDATGLEAIRDVLYGLRNDDGFRLISAYAVRDIMELVGDQWLGDRGNYTRRLSREFYTNHKVKIPKDVLSEVGNLARQHSSDVATWDVEFTRDLNQSASDFYHSESCWWTSHSESRCALKAWGGLGLRLFDGEYDGVEGRAWVQPLNEHMEPTHDTLGSRAYLVFNCYGALDGAKAARIVGHLTGWTYRRIDFDNDRQYVNNKHAWLVSDESTCSNVDDLYFSYGAHDQLDAHRITDQEVAA